MIYSRAYARERIKQYISREILVYSAIMSRNLARQISPVLHSGSFAMVLTAGFYCDSRAHNVRKVRVVKYIVVYGQIKAADQK